MKIRSILKSILLTDTALLFISACSGGGGGTSTTNNNWDEMQWGQGQWN